MIGNRVLLKWKEPGYALNHMKKQISWKNWTISFGKFVGKFALGGLALGLIVDIIASIRLGFNKVEHVYSLLLFIALLTASGIFLGVLNGVGMILSFNMSPEVSIREKDIIITSVNGVISFLFKKIQSCSIAKTKFEEQEIYFLEIKDWDGNESFIEIAPNIKSDDIIELLKTRNVQIKPSLFYPA